MPEIGQNGGRRGADLDVEGERRKRLEGRLALPPSMPETLDPLEFSEGWIAPEERYTTKYPTQ